MKINGITGYHLSHAVTRPAGNATGHAVKRQTMVIEVTTDEGISGWGESGPVASTLAVGAHLKDVLAPRILGKDPRDHRRHWYDMVSTCGYDQRGVSMMATSALDIAMHDIAARAGNVSVAAMLGGRLRDRVPAYASGPYLAKTVDPYEHYANEVEGFLKRGFRAVKPKIGVDNRTDAAAVAALRRQVGDQIGLMVDLNGGLPASVAIDVIRRMEESELLWVEEPVPAEDLAGCAAVADACATPIASGESLGSVAAFRDLAQQTGVAVLQPDITVCGGFTGYRKVADLAEALGITTVPHVWGSAVMFHASLQMTAILPPHRSLGKGPYPFIECDCGDNPFISALGTIAIESDGSVTVPDGPGLGREFEARHFEPWLVHRWEA